MSLTVTLYFHIIYTVPMNTKKETWYGRTCCQLRHWWTNAEGSKVNMTSLWYLKGIFIFNHLKVTKKIDLKFKYSASMDMYSKYCIKLWGNQCDIDPTKLFNISNFANSESVIKHWPIKFWGFNPHWKLSTEYGKLS